MFVKKNFAILKLGKIENWGKMSYSVAYPIKLFSLLTKNVSVFTGKHTRLLHTEKDIDSKMT